MWSPLLQSVIIWSAWHYIRWSHGCWLDLVVSIAGECDTSYKCVWPILEIDVVGSDRPPVTAALCTTTLTLAYWSWVIEEPIGVLVCVHAISINIILPTVDVQHVNKKKASYCVGFKIITIKGSCSIRNSALPGFKAVNGPVSRILKTF